MLNRLYAEARVDPGGDRPDRPVRRKRLFRQTLRPDGPDCAASVGGFIAIDFQDPAQPVVEKVDFDFAAFGLQALHRRHGRQPRRPHRATTPPMPAEMRSVAAAFGERGAARRRRRRSSTRRWPNCAARCTDRAIAARLPLLRGQRPGAPGRSAALRAGDFEDFKRLVIESGPLLVHVPAKRSTPARTRRAGPFARAGAEPSTCSRDRRRLAGARRRLRRDHPGVCARETCSNGYKRRDGGGVRRGQLPRALHPPGRRAGPLREGGPVNRK